MAFSFLLNQTPANGIIATWNWITLLKSVGWSDVADSDGTTYAATGGQVTGSNTGSNGLNNPYAWIRLRAPTGTKEILFQNKWDAPGETRFWRIFMSIVGFTGGSPNATQTPDATDQFAFIGSGTGTGPSFSPYWNDNGTYIQHIIASNSAPYPFYMVTYLNGTGDVQTTTFMDSLEPSSLATGDTDPVVYYSAARQGSVLDYSPINSEVGGIIGFLNNTGSLSLTNIPAAIMMTGGQVCVPKYIGTNSFTNKDEAVPLIYIRRGTLTAPTGYKGVSANLGWKGSNRGTATTLGSLSKIIFGDITFPWDSTTVAAL